MPFQGQKKVSVGSWPRWVTRDLCTSLDLVHVCMGGYKKGIGQLLRLYLSLFSSYLVGNQGSSLPSLYLYHFPLCMSLVIKVLVFLDSIFSLRFSLVNKVLFFLHSIFISFFFVSQGSGLPSLYLPLSLFVSRW